MSSFIAVVVIDIYVRGVADTAPFYWEAEGTMAKRVGNAIAGRSVHGAVMKAAYPCKDGYICWLIYGARAGAITNKEMVKGMDEKGMATEWLKKQDWEKFDPAHVTQKDFDQIMEPVGDDVRERLRDSTQGAPHRRA